MPFADHRATSAAAPPRQESRGMLVVEGSADRRYSVVYVADEGIYFGFLGFRLVDILRDAAQQSPFFLLRIKDLLIYWLSMVLERPDAERRYRNRLGDPDEFQSLHSLNMFLARPSVQSIRTAPQGALTFELIGDQPQATWTPSTVKMCEDLAAILAAAGYPVR